MTTVNLIPIHRRSARSAQRHLRAWIVGGAVYVAVLAAAWGGSAMSLRDGEKAAQETASLQEQLVASNGQRSDLRAQIDQAHHVLAAAEKVSWRADWSILMAVVSNLRGEDVVLRELTISPAGDLDDEAYRVRLAGFGRAQPAVSSLALRLERSGLFTKVTVLASRRETFAGGEAIGFEIDCDLRGEEAPSP